LVIIEYGSLMLNLLFSLILYWEFAKHQRHSHQVEQHLRFHFQHSYPSGLLLELLFRLP